MADSEFMRFWRALIGFAASNGLPEPRFGEARDWFEEFKGTF